MDRTKPNLQGTSARVGVQLVFAPRRRYGLSVAVLWYILVRPCQELFVSQDLIEAETTVSRKLTTWSKCNKDENKTKIKIK